MGKYKELYRGQSPEPRAILSESIRLISQQVDNNTELIPGWKVELILAKFLIKYRKYHVGNGFVSWFALSINHEDQDGPLVGKLSGSLPRVLNFYCWPITHLDALYTFIPPFPDIASRGHASCGFELNGDYSSAVFQQHHQRDRQKCINNRATAAAEQFVRREPYKVGANWQRTIK